MSIAEFKSIGLHTMWLTTKAYIFNVIFVFLYFFFFFNSIAVIHNAVSLLVRVCAVRPAENVTMNCRSTSVLWTNGKMNNG